MSKENDPVARFWDRYIKELEKQRVKKSAQRWYVRRAEQYIADYPQKKLTSHCPDDVTRYLSKMGRDTRFKDWQYAQIVDAILNLFRLLRVSWINQVDWTHWKAFARQLPSDHATVAREAPPLEKNSTKVGTSTTLAHIRAAHACIIDLLIAEIRIKGSESLKYGIDDAWNQRL